MVEHKSFACADCEELERVDEGYDPSKGRFIWQCRTCTRSFEEAEYHAAEKHGHKCAAQLSRRKWSCSFIRSAIRCSKPRPPGT